MKYFHDTEKRIPRSEIDQIQIYLKHVMEQMDMEYQFMICGSYRRGCPTSGDIDMLLKHGHVRTEDQLRKSSVTYLQNVVDVLEEEGFLIDHLTEHGRTKYMGYCQLNPDCLVRRVDIRFVSCDSFYPAVLYFTGSGQFNQTMRQRALKCGYTLNEYGLFKVKSQIGRKIVKGDKVKTKTEEEIFDVLNMTYVMPPDRDI